MKKILLSILVVALILLVSGCAQNNTDTADDLGSEGMTDPDSSDDATGDEMVDESTNGLGTDQPLTVSDNGSSVSQEDLDRLKEELEGLEFEDVGGLSGE